MCIFFNAQDGEDFLLDDADDGEAFEDISSYSGNICKWMEIRKDLLVYQM